ncbi:MAG: putative TadE-like family protein [Acidimicrobiales bacterium]|nr:putative TadE-like family protein [Acidimicrobiales bacterium]
MRHSNRPPVHSGRRQSGAVVVEFALVLPVLMMLLLGIISAGTVHNQQISLSYAAREGARYGATLSPDQSFTAGTWASNTRDVAIGRSGGDLSATVGTVCVSLVQGSTPTTYVGNHSSDWYSTNSDGTPCDTTDAYTTTTNDDGLRVQVVVRRDARWDMGLFARTLTLQSKVVIQSEFAS